MKWLIAINTLDFDIDLAHKVGNYIDIPQADRFEVGDDVYVFVQTNKNDTYVKYHTKVSVVRIDVGEELYYKKYRRQDDLAELIEFYMRLEFMSLSKSKGLNFSKLQQLGLKQIPSIPLKGIGDNTRLIEEIAQQFNEDAVQLKKPDIDLDLKKIQDYETKRNKFLELFPTEMWDQQEFEVLVDNRRLFNHSFNSKDYLNSNESILEYQADQGYYLSNGQVINDPYAFFELLKVDIKKFLENPTAFQKSILSNYPIFMMTILAYYRDIIYIPESKLKQIEKFFKIDGEDIFEVSQILTDQLRNAYPELDNQSGGYLSAYLDAHPKLKASTKQREKSNATSDDLILDAKILNRLGNTLIKSHRLLLRNLKYGDGIKLVNYLANRVAGKNQMVINSLNENFISNVALEKKWKNYCFTVDFCDDSQLEKLLEMCDLELGENIYLIVYDYGYRNFEPSGKLDFMLSSFYEYSVKPSFNDEVRKRLLKGSLNTQEDIDLLFMQLNKINDVLRSTNESTSLIPPSLFAFEELDLREQIEDIVEFKIMAQINRANLSQENYNDVIKLISVIINYFSHAGININ